MVANLLWMEVEIRQTERSAGAIELSQFRKVEVVGVDGVCSMAEVVGVVLGVSSES